MAGMGGSVRVAVFCAWSIALALTGSASAQPDPADGEIEMDPEPPPSSTEDGGGGAPAVDPETAKADARKLLDGGDAFVKKGDYYAKRKKPSEAKTQYQRALAAYTKAYELVPNPKILFPIGVAEEKLGLWPVAARDLRRFLTQVPDADPTMRAEAERRLENAKLQVGVLALVVTPDDVQVSLDDVVLGTSPLPDPLYLAAGDYKLTFAADGYQPLEQAISVEVGSESERTFELVAIPIIVETPKPRPAPRPEIELPPAPRKLPLIVAGGLAVGLVAGATTAGLIAVGRQATFADTSVAYPRREDARVSGKRLALLTDGLIVGAVVAAGVASYYYLKVYRPKAKARAGKQREQRAQFDEFASGPKVLVTPWVERSAGGLVLSGSL